MTKHRCSGPPALSMLSLSLLSLWMLSLSMLGACREATETARPTLVHFALLGRPLSERMDRETFGDPRVVRALSAFDYVRVTTGEGPPAAREHVRGIGSVVLLDGQAVAVSRGARAADDYLEFLVTAQRLGGRLAELRGADGPGVERAELAERLGMLEEAAAQWRRLALGQASKSGTSGATSDPELARRAQRREIELLIQLGAVARAREAFARGASDRLELPVLLAEGRAREVLDRCAPETTDPELLFRRAQALREIGARDEAAAVFSDLANHRTEPWRERASETLMELLEDRDAHRHR